MARRKREPDVDMTIEDNLALVPSEVIDPDETMVYDTSEDEAMAETWAPGGVENMSAEERKRYAFALRMTGANYTTISKVLKTDPSYVRQLIANAVRDLGTEDLRIMRATYQARLEQLLATRWPKALQGDDQSLGAVLMLLDRIERLYGLNGMPIVEEDTTGKAKLVILGGDTSAHRAQLEEQKREGNSR